MLYRPTPSRASAPSTNLHIDQIITNPGTLPFPTEAKLDSTGEMITLLQTCDWKGQSPANIAVDRRGKQLLVTFDEVTVTDHRVLPNPAVDAIRGVARTMPSAARGRARGGKTAAAATT